MNNRDYYDFECYSGVNMDRGIAGIAYLNTMCKRQSSTAISEDGGSPLGKVVHIATHELGHMFTMFHDKSNYDDHLAR